MAVNGTYLMRRFFVERHQLSSDTPLISGDDAGHIRNVLRLKPGDIIELIDGAGSECEARIDRMESGKVHVSVIRRRMQAPAPSPRLIIAQALLKDNKADEIIRQITELGVQRWIPYSAQRSVPVLNAKRITSRKERWRKIAIEALKQCQRSRLLEISEPMTFQEMLNFGASCDVRLIFWEDESPSRPFEIPSPEKRGVQSVMAILGPEGGFTVEEIAAARVRGFITVSLGPRILKADTATLAVSTLLQYGYGDMRPSDL